MLLLPTHVMHGMLFCGGVFLSADIRIQMWCMLLRSWSDGPIVKMDHFLGAKEGRYDWLLSCCKIIKQGNTLPVLLLKWVELLNSLLLASYYLHFDRDLAIYQSEDRCEFQSNSFAGIILPIFGQTTKGWIMAAEAYEHLLQLIIRWYLLKWVELLNSVLLAS